MSARMTMVGRTATSLKGIFYIVDAPTIPPELESCELILTDGKSIVFESKSDWLLRIRPGQWPQLSERYWPPAAWRFYDLAVPIGSPDWDRILDQVDLFNEMGEFCGITLRFGAGTLTIRSGASASFEWHPDQP